MTGSTQCSAPGLRKASARRCAEAGATEHQLMALFGWESPQMAALYTRKVNRDRPTREAMRLLAGSDGLSLPDTYAALKAAHENKE